MSIDPATPVLVGAAAVTQRVADPVGVEASELMIQAADRAAADAGAPDLLSRVGLVAAMASTTPYRDPARLVADGIGAAGASTLVAEPGILQQEVISQACRMLAAGELEVALLVGGEAKYRSQQAAFAEVEVVDTLQDERVAPDRHLVAREMVIHRSEIDAGLVQAVHHYALIENAIGARAGLSPVAQAREVAELWAGFNRVAVGNPDAWNRAPMSAEEIATSGPANRTLATPYLKFHNSQWNVDQAAALLLTTVRGATELGVARDRWVFPLGAAESNHMVPVVERAEIGRCPGFAVVGEACEQITGIAPGAADHLELYSCFPAAVRLQVAELGLAPGAQLTVTGGMTFAGGPFNHFVFQALVKLIEVLRADPGSTGLITSVSGMVTKQGAAMWSTEPGTAPVAPDSFADVSELAAAAVDVRAVEPGYSGPAEVVTSTVIWDRDGPRTVAAVVETPAAGRLLATADDPVVLAAFDGDPRIGSNVEVVAAAADSAQAELSLSR